MEKQYTDDNADQLMLIKFDTDRILSKPPLGFDYELFAHFLEKSDASEDVKLEYAQSIWNIMFEYASLGFDIHPFQQVMNECGQIDNAFNNSANEMVDLVNSKDKI